MKIVFSKRFEKKLKKLDKKMQGKVIETIEIFSKNPSHSVLRNHALRGAMLGKRAISVTGDVRIIFQEFDDYLVVVFLNVGTHNQVY